MGWIYYSLFHYLHIRDTLGVLKEILHRLSQVVINLLFAHQPCRRAQSIVAGFESIYKEKKHTSIFNEWKQRTFHCSLSVFIYPIVTKEGTFFEHFKQLSNLTFFLQTCTFSVHFSCLCSKVSLFIFLI